MSRRAGAIDKDKLKAQLWDHIVIDPAVGIMVNGEWSPCWQWVGARDGNNYGNKRVGDKVVKAHQATWIVYKGRLRKGRVLDHLCAYDGAGRPCCNPSHLEQVTQRENIKRGKSPIGLCIRQREALNA